MPILGIHFGFLIENIIQGFIFLFFSYSLTKPVMDFDGLFNVGRVRFAGCIDSKDPEGILLSISQACHHVVKVRTLLWSFVGLSPLYGTRLLIFNEVAKDSSFSIVAGHLPL